MSKTQSESSKKAGNGPLITAAVVAVAIVGAALFFFMAPDGQRDEATAGPSVEELLKPGPLPEISIGSKDAPVTVIEYASLTCGHCADFHKGTYPKLKEKYVDTGKLRYIFREFPLDRLSLAGFLVARCVGPDRQLPMIDLLFAEQANWVIQDPKAALAKLQGYAKQAGFTEEQYRQCLANEKYINGINEMRTRAHEKFGINSTPSFFVNGTLLKGNVGIERFEELMKPHLDG